MGTAFDSESNPGTGSAGAGDASSTASTERDQRPNPNDEELLSEINRLGQQIARAVQVAWQSEKKKELEQDLRSGIGTVVGALEESINRLSQEEETQELLDRAEDIAESVAGKVRSSRAAHEVTRGLIQGLRLLSDRVEELSQELENTTPKRAESDSDQFTGAGATGPSTDAADIPISKTK